jgi:hypothetical protein
VSVRTCSTDTTAPRDESAETGAAALARGSTAPCATTAVVPLAVSAANTAETVSNLLIRFMP